jgi:hypothetical protein
LVETFLVTYALASDHLAKTEIMLGGQDPFIKEQCNYIFEETVVVSMSCEVIDGTTGGTFFNTIPFRTLVLNEQGISSSISSSLPV